MATRKKKIDEKVTVVPEPVMIKRKKVFIAVGPRHLGDTACLTAAVHNVKKAHPEYDFVYCGAYPEVFFGNPHIRIGEMPENPDDAIRVRYGTVEEEQTCKYTMCQGYTHDLCSKLEIEDVPMDIWTPEFFLTQEELNAGLMAKGHVLINANCQACSMTKWYPHWGHVVELLPEVNFIQVGGNDPRDYSQNLKYPHVWDWRGKTDVRSLIAMAYHCKAIATPPSAIMNIGAAFGKPMVIVNGSREGQKQTNYANSIYVNNPCCGYDGINGGCLCLYMDISKKRHCHQRTYYGNMDVAKCMMEIDAHVVADKLRSIIN